MIILRFVSKIGLAIISFFKYITIELFYLPPRTFFGACKSAKYTYVLLSKFDSYEKDCNITCEIENCKCLKRSHEDVLNDLRNKLSNEERKILDDLEK